jgi:type I restriction enzyme, S subunit
MNKSFKTGISPSNVLSEGWRCSTLGNVCTVFSGDPAPQGPEFFEEGSYPFVRVQDMGKLGNLTRVVRTTDTINDRATHRMRLFPKGTVLFTKSGASTLLNQRAILGKDMFVVSHIACAIPPKEILSDWIYYWLKTVDFNFLAHATTLPSLPLSVARDIPIPIAPANEQKRIVAEIEKQFSRLDEAVASLKRAKANLKR